MANRRLALFVCAAIMAATAGGISSGLAAEPTPLEINAADWPTYNHDPAGWRYNPAETALGPANVHKLAEKWRFPAAGSADVIGVVHATPAVVDGEVYFGTATF